MASPLADFQGDAIYVDTNVLVELVDANSVYHLACAPFFLQALVLLDLYSFSQPR